MCLDHKVSETMTQSRAWPRGPACTPPALLDISKEHRLKCQCRDLETSTRNHRETIPPNQNKWVTKFLSESENADMHDQTPAQKLWLLVLRPQMGACSAAQIQRNDSQMQFALVMVLGYRSIYDPRVNLQRGTCGPQAMNRYSPFKHGAVIQDSGLPNNEQIHAHNIPRNIDVLVYKYLNI